MILLKRYENVTQTNAILSADSVDCMFYIR